MQAMFDLPALEFLARYCGPNSTGITSCRHSQRRTRFLTLTSIAVVLYFGLCVTRVLRADSPNVVIIMADDMGYSDLGCFGGEIETPTLDHLAANGLRFTNFYSENMCWVSRAAMLTGVYHKSSMFRNSIHPGCVTLPEALRQNGYQTRMSGKWHLAGKPYHIYPIDRGFDEFYGMLGGAASFFAPAFLCRNKTNVESEAHGDPNFYFTDSISNEAGRMIREADPNRPLFLYAAFNAAHWPLHAPAKDIAAYQGKYAMGWDKMRAERLARMKSMGLVSKDVSLSRRHPNVPQWQQVSNKHWQQRRMEVYAAQVTVMDRGIGRIVDALKETGRFDNTLIFFTIDNGGCHVEYTPDRKGDFLPETTRDGRPMRPGNLPEIMPGPEDTYQSYGYGWANASNTPYRMFKKYDHEGGIRTPMIAHWPDGIKSRGKLVPTVSHLIDIMPTVLDATQTPVPINLTDQTIANRAPMKMDGISLAPTFTDQEISGHKTLFFAHSQGTALRHGDWKLVAIKQKPATWELYNLKKDPIEQNDLANQMPEKVNELSSIWRNESERLAAQAKLDIPPFDSSRQPESGQVEITFLANEGFLIRKSGVSLLIDAFVKDEFYGYGAIPQKDYDNLIAGNPPFNEIQYSFTTHEHLDHFQVAPAIDFLTHNKQCKFLSTEQVILKARHATENADIQQRLEIIWPEENRSRVEKLEGLTIETFRLRHANPRNYKIQNLGLLLNLHGTKILHVGDAELREANFESCHFATKEIDIAILPDWLMGDKNFLDKHFAAKQYIAAHIPAASLKRAKARFAGSNDKVYVFDAFMKKHVFETGQH